jgi:hypothetical protein
MGDYSMYIPQDWGISNLNLDDWANNYGSVFLDPLAGYDYSGQAGIDLNNLGTSPYIEDVQPWNSQQTFADWVKNEYTPSTGGGLNLSSVLQGASPIVTGLLSKFFASKGAGSTTPGYNQKPSYQTAAEQDILGKYKDYVNQPAIPDWVQALYYQNIAPTLAGAETGEEKARKAYLKALTDMGMSEFDAGQESYDTAVQRFKDVANGIDLKDVSPGFRGTEWDSALQDYLTQNMDVAKNLATLDMTRGKEKQQTLENLLGMKTSATAASQAATDPLAKASILANAANLPYSQNLAQKGTALGQYSNAANKVAVNQQPTTFEKENPWLQGLGAGLLGATQNQVVQNQLPQQQTTTTPSLWKSLFG